MVNEEVRKSVSTGISMLGLYLQQVIEDQGIEKALEYYNKVGYSFGSGTATTIKERYGDKPPTPEELKQVLAENLNGFGQDFKISTAPNRVDVTINKCPFYEGLSRTGLSHEVITQFCKSGGGGELDAMKDLIPGLEPFSKPRSHAGDVCVEGFKISNK